MRFAPLLAFALAAMTPGCATYATLDERTAMLAPRMEYYAPSDSAGAAPLVILASGCGGLNGLDGPKAVMKNYASAATTAGAYVVVFDSFAPRGIGFEESVAWVCSGMRLRGDARAADIIAAEALAREHWKRDFSGVILAGWSHGGWAVMELLSAGPDANVVGNFHIKAPTRALTPDAVALYYPYCGLLNSTGRSRWAFKGPLFLLTADADSPGAGKECSDVIAHARGGLDGVESIHFPNNTHAFDESDQVPGSEFTYDPEATERSLALFGAFIRQQAERLN